MFYLGESFMNPRLLVDCITHVKRELGFPYVFLTSNASMAFPEAVESCMAAGLDSLKWSVNAADEEQFKSIMGVAGNLFHRALDNIAAAHGVRARGGHKTGLYASSIRYDGAQQAKMEALLDTRVRPYVDEHYWLPLYSMGAFATTREEELRYRPTAGKQGRIGGPALARSAAEVGHEPGAVQAHHHRNARGRRRGGRHVLPRRVVHESAPAGGLHTASTRIVKTDQFQVFRYVLLKDKVFAEHRVPAAITVQCLEGVIEFKAAGREQLLRTAQLVYLGEGTPHSLKGIEDASVLVTIVAGAQRNPASA